jgi:2-C-methyl-D-erythritol 4-phosphate cytidylyltransferase
VSQQPARTVIILAAGEGKRMRSPVPKVLHELLGRTLVGHVLEGNDVAHVVFRMRVAADGVTITKVQAMSLRRLGPTWRVLLSGDFEGLAAQSRLIPSFRSRH